MQIIEVSLTDELAIWNLCPPTGSILAVLVLWPFLPRHQVYLYLNQLLPSYWTILETKWLTHQDLVTVWPDVLSLRTQIQSLTRHFSPKATLVSVAPLASQWYMKMWKSYFSGKLLAWRGLNSLWFPWILWPDSARLKLNWILSCSQWPQSLICHVES